MRNVQNFAPLKEAVKLWGLKKSQESEMATELTWHDVLAEEKQQPYFVNTHYILLPASVSQE